MKHLLAFTVTVIITNPLITSAKSCFDVHRIQRSVFDYPEILRSLHNETANLSRLLKQKSEANADQIKVAAQKVDAATLAYLKLADIDFIQQKVESRFYWDEAGNKSLLIPHSIFQVQGRKTGDEASRMIFAAQLFATQNGHGLKVEIDPVRGLFDGISGFYVPRVDSITVMSETLAEYLVGSGNTFRHELQHYFEDIKVRTGQMSLARLALSKDESSKSDEAYADRYSADEIEAQLRDIRVLQLWQNSKSKEERLREVYKTEDWIQELRRRRHLQSDNTTELLFNMLSSTRSALESLKAAAADPKKLPRPYKEKGILRIEIPLPATAKYSRLTVEVGPLLRFEDFNHPERVQEVLHQIIEHAESRMRKIEDELLQILARQP